MNYLLAIDQGTTGTRTIVMDENLQLVADAYSEFKQHFPTPGWVEHDAEEIWQSTVKTIGEVTQKIDPKKIASIGITNQRETVCFWKKGTTETLAHAIVWQDRRTTEICEALQKKGMERYFQENTGLIIDPYFSGTKIAWAIKNWEPVKDAHRAGELAVGTIDSFLVAKLTDGSSHVTEPSNASRTQCFNLHKKQWDDELCSALSVPKEVLPEIRPSTGLFGKTKNVPGLPDGIPITGILGDQQSALMGQACISEGTAKCTYGTGAFLLMNTGDRPITSHHRLLTTVAWSLKEGQYTYALEGSAFIAGAAVQWLRDGLQLIKRASEIDDLARTVESSDGVYFVPSLTGLGAPHWDANARGMLTGLTRGTKRGHIARAVLEGIAYQNTDILFAMQKDLGKPLATLNVDGGAAANDMLMQFQSSILGVQLRRPQFLETTALGAVFASGLGSGIWKDLNEVEKSWIEDRTFSPEMENTQRESLLKGWRQAVARVKHHES